MPQPQSGPIKPRHPRQGILDLTQGIYKNFKPLVNEKTKMVEAFEVLPGRQDLTRDQLIMLAVAAIADTNDFIKVFEGLKERYEHLTSDALVAYARGKERGLEAESLCELIDSIIGKYDQACDVIRNIQTVTNDPAVKALTSEYLSRFVIEGAKVVHPDFGAPGGSPDAPQPPASEP